MLLAANKSLSRPDFLVGLGLLVGGCLIGLTTGPVAGRGAFPAEALILGAALFWAVYGDEADALQPGDRLLPVVAIAGGGLILHFGFTAAGTQPVLQIGRFMFRPFELPALALVGYLWYRVRFQKGERRASGFTDLSRRNVTELLWATLAASLASMVGGGLGDACRFLLLCLVPVSLIYRAFATNPGELARIAAVSAACTLGFVGLVRSTHLQQQQSWLHLAMQENSVVTTHFANLQRPVDLALQSWAHAEPQRLYTDRQGRLVRHLQKVRDYSNRGDFQGLVSASQELAYLVVTHSKWSREVFDAVAMRTAQWGDEEATKRAESRARSGHEESRLAHRRGFARLLELQSQLANALASFGDGIASTATMMGALFLASVMLGLALLMASQGLVAQPDKATPTAQQHRPSPDRQPKVRDDHDDDDHDDTVDLPEMEATAFPEAEALAQDMERLALAMTELHDYLDKEPVAEAAFDCLVVLKEAGRCLSSEKLLASASALERILKEGGERWQVTEAAADLSTVCDGLAPTQGS